MKVAQIWERFSRAEVDLFASRANTHCLLFFSMTDSNAPLGMDVQAHPWPNTLMYVSPQVEMILPVLERVQWLGLSLIVCCLQCRLAVSSPQGPPVSGKGRGDSPPPRAMAAACLPVERANLIARGLPSIVVATIQSARARI